MELQGPLYGRCLIWVRFTDSDHGVKTLLSKKHFVKTKECVLKGLSIVLAGLEFRLVFEFLLKILFTKLCALKTTVSVEYRK